MTLRTEGDSYSGTGNPKCPAAAATCPLTLESVFVHLLDDAGQGGHVVLGKGDAQVVPDEVVARVQHRGRDKVQDVGSQA